MGASYTKSAPIASGGTLFFNEESHSYWDSLVNEAYESVTSLINFYVPEFDAKTTSERVALRRGVRPDEVLTEWEGKAERACNLGTRVHAHQEALIVGKHPATYPRTEYEAGIFEAGAKAVLGMRRLGFEVIATEMMVALPADCIAGTIDLLLKKDSNYYLIDWKTNAVIRDASQYGTKMCAPFSHLDHCELVTYSIQLSLYEYILKHEWYVPDTATCHRVIAHLASDGTPRQIAALDMNAEAQRIIALRQRDREVTNATVPLAIPDTFRKVTQ